MGKRARGEVAGSEDQWTIGHCLQIYSQDLSGGRVAAYEPPLLVNEKNAVAHGVEQLFRRLFLRRESSYPGLELGGHFVERDGQLPQLVLSLDPSPRCEIPRSYLDRHVTQSAKRPRNVASEEVPHGHDRQ